MNPLWLTKLAEHLVVGAHEPSGLRDRLETALRRVEGLQRWQWGGVRARFTASCIELALDLARPQREDIVAAARRMIALQHEGGIHFEDINRAAGDAVRIAKAFGLEARACWAVRAVELAASTNEEDVLGVADATASAAWYAEQPAGSKIGTADAQGCYVEMAERLIKILADATDHAVLWLTEDKDRLNHYIRDLCIQNDKLRARIRELEGVAAPVAIPPGEQVPLS